MVGFNDARRSMGGRLARERLRYPVEVQEPHEAVVIELHPVGAKRMEHGDLLLELLRRDAVRRHWPERH